MSAASSGVARGKTPGSLKLVRNSVDKTKIKFKAAITGMAGVTSVAKKGQLKRKIRQLDMSSLDLKVFDLKGGGISTRWLIKVIVQCNIVIGSTCQLLTFYNIYQHYIHMYMHMLMLTSLCLLIIYYRLYRAGGSSHV